MRILQRDPILGPYSRLYGIWLYIAPVVLVYTFGVVCCTLDGTLLTASPGIIPFVFDWMFHLFWMFSIPCGLLLLVRHCRIADSVLSDLEGARIINPRHLGGRWWRQLSSISPSITGMALGGCIALIVFCANVKTLVTTHTYRAWWLTGPQVTCGSVFFFLICVLAAMVLSSVLLRYLCLILAIREACTRDDNGSLPSWIAFEYGPLYRLFSSFFLAMLPLAIIPVCVWANRTYIMHVYRFDAVTLLNAASIPCFAVVFLVIPLILCGIPSKMRAQRHALALVNAKQMDAIFDKMRHASTARDHLEISELVRDLTAQREMIDKHYPTWPFPVSSIYWFLATGTPAFVTAITAVVRFITAPGT